MSERPRHPETSVLHPRGAGDAITPAIEPASTFAARDVAHLRELGSRPREQRFYTRYGNPTHAHAEAIVAELEGAQAARLFSSGMAAMSTAVLALCAPGDHVVAQTVHYAGTLALLQRLAPRMGIDVAFVDQADTAGLTGAIEDRTRLVILETPSNPQMAITDLRAVSEAAHRHDALVLVDNTFATPINQRPLELGADLVMHSATKYLGGHSDLLAGVVAGRASELEEIWEMSLTLGGALGPFDAWLLQRGLRTLAVRVARQNQTALALATRLAEHPAVRVVHYPGLATHPQHELAAAQMDGYGGVLSFELHGGVF
jgi:methionine-gamma-lyase